uniref:CSON010513 protein n=1 Tax=Culicoides sonorensis TaxID=179676 RepID=A0A336LPI6_CULSO
MGLKPQNYRCSLLTVTFLVLFFIGIQTAYSKDHQQDTDIESIVQNNNFYRNKRSIESNHDIEEIIDEKLDDSREHWLTRSVNRIKRSLGLAIDESKDLNRKHKSKRKNSSEIVNTEHSSHETKSEENSLKKLSKNKRKHLQNEMKRIERVKKRRLTHEDDEDNNIVEGSGHSLSTYESADIRIKFVLNEVWDDEFENFESTKFGDLENQFGHALVKLIKEGMHQEMDINAKLVKLTKIDNFQMNAVVDLSSKQKISYTKVNSVLSSAIETQTIGDFTVPSFNLQSIEDGIGHAFTHANTSYEHDYDSDEDDDEDDLVFVQCNFGELQCDDGTQCYRESEKCDGYFACNDKSDEAGCPKIRDSEEIRHEEDLLTVHQSGKGGGKKIIKTETVEEHIDGDEHSNVIHTAQKASNKGKTVTTIEETVEYEDEDDPLSSIPYSGSKKTVTTTHEHDHDSQTGQKTPKKGKTTVTTVEETEYVDEDDPLSSVTYSGKKPGTKTITTVEEHENHGGSDGQGDGHGHGEGQSHSQSHGHGGRGQAGHTIVTEEEETEEERANRKKSKTVIEYEEEYDENGDRIRGHTYSEDHEYGNQEEPHKKKHHYKTTHEEEIHEYGDPDTANQVGGHRNRTYHEHQEEFQEGSEHRRVTARPSGARRPGNDENLINYNEEDSTDFPDRDLIGVEFTTKAQECRGDDRFRCPGTSIFICEHQKCDGVRDCPNAEDESHEDCDGSDLKCKNGEQFFCPWSSTYVCETSRCDKIIDCPHGEDEENCKQIEPECADDEFACDVTRCIPLNQRCNGYADCDDGTDEHDCPHMPHTECNESEFKCNDGTCIPQAYRCNSKVDCQAGEDELDCDITDNCIDGQWQCPSGGCIDQDAVCDGTADCPGREDEDPEKCICKSYESKCLRGGGCFTEIQRCDNVPFNCTDNQYQCRTTLKCINRLNVCNGDYDCPTGEDEMICECPANEEKCEIGGGCYVPAQKCDGFEDCLDGSDEFDCPDQRCEPDEFSCDGRCRSLSVRCDGIDDCDDLTDEENCPLPEDVPRPPAQPQRCPDFTCNDGRCASRCDGRPECYDSADEEQCPSTPTQPDVPDNRLNLKTYPNDQIIKESREVVFQCRDEGPLRAKVRWVRGRGLPLPPGTRDVNGRLEIPNIRYDHSGEYVCEAVGYPKSTPGSHVSVNLQVEKYNPIVDRPPSACVPLVLWRLNWGHVPDNCVSESEGGFGTLICRDIRPSDQGAYSCEVINTKGTTFASPDTIVIVNTDRNQVCQNGFFNDLARRPEECINCFCFGVSTQCSGANLFSYTLPQPTTSLTVLGVEGPWNGRDGLKVGEYENHDLTATRHGVQLRLADIPTPTNQYPYYALPNEYLKNQLKSYGGHIRYEVVYNGRGASNDAPDIIITGNGREIVYRHPTRLLPDQPNPISAVLSAGAWYKLDGTYASREEILVVLANIDNILIKLQYVDGPERVVELLRITLDSAASTDRGLGPAALVEECRCPAGYRGLSCEECDYGYERQASGPWLGRCIRVNDVCRPGTYGDPQRGIPCRPCPCPGTSGNSYAASCTLGRNGDVQCNCERGYVGSRCEECAPGYVGNPIAAQPCIPAQTSRCNPYGTESTYPNGQCNCRSGVTGTYCDQCAPGSFHLHQNGCLECFCNGVTKSCTSSNWYRDKVESAFAGGRSEFNLVSNNRVVASNLPVEGREVVYRNFGATDDAVYWSLPSEYLGDKITAYGGNLTYTLRYTPLPSGSASRNSAPDVIIMSHNQEILHHYRRDGGIPLSSPSTYIVPIIEEEWQSALDGTSTTRPKLLTALSDVQAIYIKATYTTVPEEAALEHISLDTASERNYGSGIIAYEVEQCRCVTGTTGLSCHECSPGYFKSLNYPGTCEPCNCHGHSETCDPKTGQCLDCRHATTGHNCERCAPGYTGSATRGTPNDCVPDRRPPQSDICELCDPRGTVEGTCYPGASSCTCRANVVGQYCSTCRDGTFGLSLFNPDGCAECFCSGTRAECSELLYHREELPVPIFDETHGYRMTNRENTQELEDRYEVNSFEAKLSYSFPDEGTFYWSLPARLLGNQILSYGGNLTITQFTEGRGSYVPDQDVIIKGNGLTLFWQRRYGDDGTYHIPLIESEWQNLHRSGVRPTSRNDLLTVLSNIDYILVRATLKEMTTKSSISDVYLDTAVPQQTAQGPVHGLEYCKCPPGYKGTSCESCDKGYYRDHYDRSANLLGTCKLCPCEHADSCELGPNSRIICHCEPGYSGDRCQNPERPPIPTRYPPYQPNIRVTIREPKIQIVEKGEQITLTCSGYYIIERTQLPIRWYKEGGSLSSRAYQDQYTLYIKNIQIDDSGVYVCEATKDGESVSQKVTITVGEDGQYTLPQLTVQPSTVDVEEFQPVEVICTAISGYPEPQLQWQRLDDRPFTASAYHRDGVLRIASASKADEGSYRCVGANTVGEHDQIIQIYVRDRRPPAASIYVIPDRFDGNEGEDVTLRCETGRRGTVEWIKQGERELAPRVVVRGETLVIRQSSVEDTGRYLCTVRLSDGSVQSAYSDVSISSYRPPSTGPKVREFDRKYVVVQGQDFSLACEATGDPRPTILWSISGGELPSNVQQSGNIIRILNARPENSGVYVCVAESAGGSDQSATIIEVERRESPLVELHPKEPQVLRVGESTRFACRVLAGIPYPTVTWARVDGRPLPAKAEQDYPGVITFHSVALSDAGTYQCLAVNEAGTTSLTSTLEVQEPPMASFKPDDPYMFVREGSNIDVVCTATGYPTPNVVIKTPKGQVYDLSAGTTRGVLGSARVSINNADKNHDGVYECEATNAAGKDIKYTRVQVGRGDQPPDPEDEYPYPPRPYPPVDDRVTERPPPPTYPGSLTRYPAHLGSRSLLTCNFEGREIRTEWRREDGLSLPRSAQQYNGNLIIEDTEYDAAGIYECLGVPPNGEPFVLQKVEIVVVALPRITFSPPMPMTVRPGENVVIHCNATGEQPLTVQWHPEGGGYLPNTVRASGHYLQFSSITPNDAGRYYCTASNVHGNTTKVAEVIVNREDIYERQRPGRSQEVNEGDTIALDCLLPSESQVPGVRFEWHRNDQVMPRTVQYRDNQLILTDVSQYDAGTYECRMIYSNGQVTRNQVELKIKRYEIVSIICTHFDYVCVPRDILCESICTGYKQCVERTNEEVCKTGEMRTKKETQKIHRRPMKYPMILQKNYLIERDQLPTMTIAPTRSYLKVGESAVVDCESSEGSDVAVTWEKSGSRSLPSNVYQSGNRLYIQDATERDAGRYSCIGYTSDNKQYVSDYELIVTPLDEIRTKRFPKVEYAAVGSSLDLRCDSDGYDYLWTRQHGSFQTDQNVNTDRLSLSDVQANDAGTYVCTARKNEQRVDHPIILVVTGAIPFFPQSPNSYMTFNKIDKAYSKFNFEVTFKPEQDDGLILYNGGRKNDGDYIALSLRDGYVQFKYKFGGQQGYVESAQPIQTQKWTTVKVNRQRQNGFMIVDDQAPVSFSNNRFYGLNLEENLYLGGVPNYDNIARDAVHEKRGFVGCISRLSINEREIQLNQEAIKSEGTTACEPCANEPCKHAGVCLETQTKSGYTCVCQEGYTGKNCQVEGNQCTPDVCNTGRCEDTDDGVSCFCPLNRTGDRCQYREHYDGDTLSFKDGSYAAYDRLQSKKTLKFRIRPNSVDDSVILYTAESEKAYGDYFAVVIKDRHVELRYSVGGKITPVIIRSEMPLKANEWTEVSVGRTKNGVGFLQVGNEAEISEPRLSARAQSIYLKTPLYVGGYDKRILLNQGLEVSRGFDGCITGLEIAGRSVNMIAEIKDAANVENCGHSAATDENDINNEIQSGTCHPGYIGVNCETMYDACLALEPCENGGTCQSIKNGEYKCLCQYPFSGLNCENVIELQFDSHFKDNSYLEVNRSALSNKIDLETTGIAILFTTKKSDGLLFWQGQPKGTPFEGQDFLALAIVDGLIEFSFRLNEEESVLKNTFTKVDDGNRHVVIIKQEQTRFSLEVDSFVHHGETRPTGKSTIHLPGNLFIGGAPDIISFTGNRFTQNFNGCIHMMETTEGTSINLTKAVITGVNVDSCPNHWLPSSLVYNDLDLFDFNEEELHRFDPTLFDEFEEPPPVHIIKFTQLIDASFMFFFFKFQSTAFLYLIITRLDYYN